MFCFHCPPPLHPVARLAVDYNCPPIPCEYPNPQPPTPTARQHDTGSQFQEYNTIYFPDNTITDKIILFLRIILAN